MKLDFEIAVDQQTRACDRTFEGVPDSRCQLVPAGQPRPYLVNCWPNFAKLPKRACSYLSPEHMYISFIKIEYKLAEL